MNSTCEHCRYAIAPYKPMPTHDGSRWYCTKHFAGKWWDETCEKWEASMKSFEYATDSSSGFVTAGSIQAAYDKLRATITPEMIRDGATLWVQDDTGKRITMED